MALQIWIDDKLVDESEAKISVFDHGLLYGDGVFEGIRVYEGRIFEMEAHLERLYNSANVIRLEIPMTKAELTDATEKTVKANNITNGYIRLVITRGIGLLGIDPFNCKEPQVIIIAAQIQLYPEELYEKGIKVISASTLRNHPMSLPPEIKSLNYLNNILAKIEANDKGALEAIMYNCQGHVAEASADNVFIISDGSLLTPPIKAGALPGITRDVVMKLAEANDIEVEEKSLTCDDLYAADEFFLTGTGAEIIGIVELDGRVIGNGKPGVITKLLRKKFFEYTCEK